HFFGAKVYRGGLHDDSQIAARTDRNGVADHCIAEELDIVLLQTEAVVIRLSVPVLHADDHVDAGVQHHTLHAEQALYIHDTDTTKLDKMSRDVRGSSDQRIVADLPDLH